MADNGTWVLVYKHDSTKGFFSSTAEALSINGDKDPSTVSKYSLLSDLEQFRGKDGNFHFRLVYPEIEGKANEWKQSSNPTVTQEAVHDYQPVSITWDTQHWGGLAKSSISHALIDGSVGNSQWYYAIGTTLAWRDGVPGPKNAVHHIELYVFVEGKPCSETSTDLRHLGHTVLQFRGGNDRFLANPISNFPQDALTVEFWLNTSVSTGGLVSYAVNGPKGDNEFLIYGAHNPGLHIKGINLVAKASFNDGRWHHMAMTWESAGGTIKLFKDGEEVFSGTHGKGAQLKNGGCLVFGQEQDKVAGGFQSSQAYLGRLCEVRIWKKVRSPGEIQSAMNCMLKGDEDGLTGYWPLDELQSDGKTFQTLDLTGHHNGNVIDAVVVGDEALPLENRIYGHDYHKILTENETRNRCTGWIESEPDDRDWTLEKMLENHLLPEGTMIVNPDVCKGKLSVDLSPGFPPIENQGTIGSCTANAAVSLLEYYEKKAFGRFTDGSRLFIYKIGRKLGGLVGDSGANLRDVMKGMAIFGVPPEEYWPYDVNKFDEEPSAFVYGMAQNYQTLSYYKLDFPDKTREELLQNVKSHLAAGHPLVFGMVLYKETKKGEFLLPEPGEEFRGGHAMAIVGYDDERLIGPHRGALKVRSSWGENWGEKGYGWVPYDFVRTVEYVGDFWCLFKAEYLDTHAFRDIDVTPI